MRGGSVAFVRAGNGAQLRLFSEWQRRRAHRAEQRPLPAAPAHHQSGAAQVTQTRKQRLEQRAGRTAYRDGFAKAGERVIVVAGVPFGTPGTTNMVRIATIGSDSDANI